MGNILRKYLYKKTRATSKPLRWLCHFGLSPLVNSVYNARLGTNLVLVDATLTLVVLSLTRLTLVDLQPVRSLKGARSCVTETFQWRWLVGDLLNVMLVRFHRSLWTTTLPEVGRVDQKEKEVFHSDDIKVRDNYQLRVNWVQVALIVEMTKKGAGSAQ